jgi:signal transduction histidine kinase
MIPSEHLSIGSAKAPHQRLLAFELRWWRRAARAWCFLCVVGANAILGYTELIVDGIYGAPPEKMAAVLKRIESNGKHLLGLINAVLDLSKIEAGQLVLDLADYSLKNVVQVVVAAVEPLATDKKLAIKVDVATGLPTGRGDERRLTQVLLNLVGNAIKFTDTGEVSIRGSSANGSFNVAVQSTPAGAPRGKAW